MSVLASLTWTIPGTQFQVPLSVVILGFITGLTYALLGMGLTLIYRTSRVINFAAGSMGALAAVFVPILVYVHHWSYWPSLILTLVGALVIGALVEFLVIRRLHNASRLTVLVATIGVAQLLTLAATYVPGFSATYAQIYPVPFHASIRVGGLTIDSAYLLILIIVPLITIGLSWFLRRSKTGRASRASAENARAASLAGIPVFRVSLVMWALAGLLSGVAAILIDGTQPVGLSGSLGPQLLLRALAAAMLGGLLRLPSVFVGGIVLGVVEALILWNYQLDGTLELVLFVLIVLSLLGKRGIGVVARGAEESSWSLAGKLRALPPALAQHPRVRSAKIVGLAVVAVAAIVLPLPFSTSQQATLTTVVVFAMIGLSLVVLTGFAGQVSLGQFGFVAIGAAVSGRLLQLGLPVLACVAVATMIGGIIALVIGVPSLWIRGLFLAVTTLGFSIVVSSWMFNQGWLVPLNSPTSSLTINRFAIAGWSLAAGDRYYWLCLLSLAVVGVLVAVLRRSRLGRSMVACRDNESAATAIGISPRIVKLSAFVISGMIASFGGFLYGGLLVGFGYDPSTTFGPSLSLTVLVMTVLGGVTTITGAVLGAAWVEGIPSLLGQSFGLLSSGIGLIIILIVAPGGLASIVFRVRDALAAVLVKGRGRGHEAEPALAPAPAGGSRLEPAAVAGATFSAAAAGVATLDRPPAATLDRPPATPRAGRPAAAASSPPPALEASDITVRYGGLVALAGISIRAEPGEIVGLMGTNGSGKTTLFDVLSGRLRPNGGKVVYAGVDVTRWSPNRRARVGFGRTFQQARLFDGLSLIDVVKLAREQSAEGDAAGRPDVRELLDRLGLLPYEHRYPDELSTGTRRLVELACVAASNSRLLLLDEPTAGFAPAEVDDFCDALRELRVRLDATVVVIDHDVPMMANLVERLYVLEAGTMIAEGTAAILREDPAVRAAYLGQSDVQLR